MSRFLIHATGGKCGCFEAEIVVLISYLFDGKLRTLLRCENMVDDCPW
ncbi:MAG: hypothetical protein AB7S66_06750 [Sphaerochaeta sp.]